MTGGAEPTQCRPLVDIEGLSIGFAGANGGRPLVSDIDLKIHAGECVALVGESGSGKSITARSLLNLAGPGARIDARKFEISGRDALRFSETEWRRIRGTAIGLVMQDALVSLDPLRTIGQEVSEDITSHGIAGGAGAVRARGLDVLRKVGISNPEDRWLQYAHQLSGGQRQRALIASAIAGEPDLIIADEPTTSLDVTVQARVLRLLAERIHEGAGLLLISHDLAVVAGIADRVTVMRAGKVVDSGPTRDVLTHPRHPYTRDLIAAVPSLESRNTRLASARFDLDEPSEGRSEIRVVREALPARRPVGDVVLEARDLSKAYAAATASGRHTTLALRNVSFQVRAGEVVSIVGESGSGKSTCAKIVLGLLAPDEGEVRLLGQAWSGVPEQQRKHLRRKLQYIPQDALSSFDPRYRVQDIIGENLSVGLGRAARRDVIVALLDSVGLGAVYLDRRPRSLSGGQRQRVSIARALAADPAIIVCDEPVSALDISVQAQVLDLLTDLQSRLGTALLFISHDLGVVQHLADRVLVFQAGQVIEQGAVETVLKRPAHAYTQDLLAAVPRIARDANSGFGSV